MGGSGEWGVQSDKRGCGSRTFWDRRQHRATAVALTLAVPVRLGTVSLGFHPAAGAATCDNAVAVAREIVVG
jgi:hypothetical protein